MPSSMSAMSIKQKKKTKSVELFTRIIDKHEGLKELVCENVDK